VRPPRAAPVRALINHTKENQRWMTSRSIHELSSLDLKSNTTNPRQDRSWRL
jgi:hypothetical protein